jgi:hypothetical protein
MAAMLSFLIVGKGLCKQSWGSGLKVTKAIGWMFMKEKGI